MDVFDTIKHLPKEELFKAKAQLLAERPKPAKFQRKGFEIEIESMREVNGLFEVVAKAWDDKGPVKVDNPLFYRNPPFLIWDGTLQTIINSKGKEEVFNNYIEDLDEALKEMVAETIRVLNK